MSIDDAPAEITKDINNNYSIRVNEILSRVVCVSAFSEANAIDNVKEMYQKSEIILDADDLKEVNFESEDNNYDN